MPMKVIQLSSGRLGRLKGSASTVILVLLMLAPHGCCLCTARSTDIELSELRTAFEYTLAKAGWQSAAGRKKALSGEPDRALDTLES
jgi:hypothetical protein